MKFLIGILLIIVGVCILKYRYKLYHITGDWAWAMKYFGSNGTIFIISLIGFVLIVVGAGYPFGILEFEGGPSPLPAGNIRME